MKKVYQEIWQLAKPFYKKGRKMDVNHIEWMIKDALIVCKKENLDDTIFMPLVILHDIGYSKIKKDDPFKLDIRRKHMQEGAKLSQKILERINYPKNKSQKIIKYILIHDNWAFGETEIYKNDKLLAVFTDLDFTWMATPIGFKELMKILKKNKKEMLKYLSSRKTPAKSVPFSTKTTKSLFTAYLRDRRKEIET